MSQNYDCVIVGGGPAGLGAALYSSRDRFKTVILEKFFPGGQIINTDRIENFPGFENIAGAELVQKLMGQVQNFGTEIKTGVEVKKLRCLSDGRIEVDTDKDTYIARSVILAPGSSYAKLGVPGEDEFRNAGAGVSYCGTCDAPFFRGKEVVAIGGGNTAVEEALHLANFASKVTLIHRRDEFRATNILKEELGQKAQQKDSNIVIKYNTIATEILGDNKVQRVRLKDVNTGVIEDYPCDGVFIFIGTTPNTNFLEGFVDLTDSGFIKCDPAYLRTKVTGVFAAGDCRVNAPMQLATAISDGIVAAMMQKQHFRDPGWWHRPIEDIHLPQGW